MVVAGTKAEDEPLNGLKGGQQSDDGAEGYAHVQSESLKPQRRGIRPAPVSSAMGKHKH